MVNLFIVESPFQFLSAIEANHYFKNEENILIIKYSSYRTHQKNNEQLTLLRDFSAWKEVIEIEASYSTRLSNLKLLFFLNKVKSKYANLDKIFIGEYRSWVQREYCNVLNPNECFVLDDGNMALELQKTYIPFGRYFYFGATEQQQHFERFQHKILSKLLLRQKGSERKDFNLFTCFNLMPYSPKQTVIKHSFEYLKREAQQKDVLKNTVYFFGSNLSELDLMSKEEEKKLLKSILEYFKNRNINMVYLPHRRESSHKLDYIQNTLGIQLRYSKYPAEIEFVMMDKLPQYLASILSTALHTVSKIATFDEVIAFKMSYDKINEVYLEDIATTYEEYHKTMKVIDLNELN